MTQFKLTSEYIQLNNLLKALSLVGSGGEAKMHILEGLVRVNNLVEIQVRKKLRDGDQVEFNGEIIKVVK
ncbi:MAG: RNA-binding S4 domain-containing protein [Flavobacteriales bacterium]|nr:RNA-binding S4 domain-containing protein [Flavobacteriales bacterium]